MSTPDVIGTLGDAQIATLKPLAPRRRHNTNKGRRFPPEPIRVQDFAALLSACMPLTPGRHGILSAARLRALMVLLDRTGMRISEALAVTESDLMREHQAIVVRRGKGGKRRIIRMDEWGWGELDHWLEQRRDLPPGPIICILRGRHGRGVKALSDTDARRQLRDAGRRAGLHRRCAPHQWRHGFSVEFHRETGNLIALQRQLGHSSPSVTGVYLRGIDDLEALEDVARRPPPRIVIPPSATNSPRKADHGHDRGPQTDLARQFKPTQLPGSSR